jgi:hypothetical protein
MLNAKNFFKRSPFLSLLLLTLVLMPQMASAAGFLSSGFATSQAKAVIQILGSVGIALTVGLVLESFFQGTATNWLSKAMGIIAGVIVIVDPGILSTALSNMGL